MTRKTKGRAGGHQATPKTSSKYHSTGMAFWVKGVIVTLAVGGLLPIGVADWLIHRGGQRDV